MHAYLITGQNTSLIDKEIEKIIRKLNSFRIDNPIISIDDARKLSQLLHLNPGKPTSIIARNIELASTEALNSLLKAIEEPGENISFIFTSDSVFSVIPTIVSRCQVIKLTNSHDITPDYNLAQTFNDRDLTGKFELISQIGGRDEAVTLVSDLISLLHKKLLEEHNKGIAKKIKHCQFALTSLKSNGNVNLQLTNLAINI